MSPIWYIVTLGEFRVEPRDVGVPGLTAPVTRFRTQKTAALLAYLARHPDRPHAREELVGLLWPDAPPVEGRASLRTAVASLRRQLEPPGVPTGAVLDADRSFVRLIGNAAPADVTRFSALLAPAAPSEDDLMAAVALYGGPFLPGSYEEWALEERVRLEGQYLGALSRLAALRRAHGDLNGALEYARRALNADPLREESHTLVMELLHEMGQPPAALWQYRELERLLREQLGDTPSPTARALAARISARAEPATSPPAAVLTTVPPAPPSPTVALPAPAAPSPAPAGYLPVRRDRFFGREEEMAHLEEALTQSGSTPLVTLVGAGGAGKTRLAIEAAARLRDHWHRGGAWFVPLAEVRDGAGLAEAVRDALRLPRRADADPLTQAAEALSAHPALLLLDNFEQIGPDGAAVVETLLRRAGDTGLALLVTSRRRLALPGEQVIPLAPLPVPVPGSETTPETLSRNATVRLFLDRARAGRPDFQVTARTAPAVAALCTHLEGVPLAVELAAAWSPVLGPAGMLERLEERGVAGRDSLLTAPARTDRPERHRSVWSAIAWSCDLLSPEARRFFARLSVFRGGWSVEAAQTVCAEPRALDLLAHLAERSLVRTEETAGGDVRFGLLETLREFAAQMPEAEDRDALADRHARFFLAVGEQTREASVGERDIARRFDAVEADLDNYRAALEHLLSRSGGEPVAGYLAACLQTFWISRGRVREGRRWLEQALKAEEQAKVPPSDTFSIPSGARLVTLSALGKILLRQEDLPAAEATFAQALEAARDIVKKDGGRPSTGLADTLNSLGNLAARRHDYAAARSWFEQSLAERRRLGDTSGVAVVLNNLGTTAYFLGDNQASRTYHEESIRIRRERGETRALAVSLSNLGFVLLFGGNFVEADRYCREALMLRREIGEKGDTPDSLEIFARLAAVRGDRERAVRLAGAAAGQRALAGVPPTAWNAANLEEYLAPIRAALGEATYAAAFAQGEALSWDEAIACALGEDAA
jgi:predicted ATPase/DNA-binding SARP family transcriptional activator